MSRHHPLARDAHIHALLSCPLIHDLGGDLDAHRRRAPAHPLALHLAYGALARLYGSAHRLDADLAAGGWRALRDAYNPRRMGRPRPRRAPPRHPHRRPHPRPRRRSRHRPGRPASRPPPRRRRVACVVYDGAFRGVHHQQVMADLGAVVVNKVHARARSADGHGTWRPVILGNWTHQPDLGQPCTHTLVAHNGAVHDSQLDDTGDPLRRRQIRRYPRRHGGWRFTLGVEISCPRRAFTARISPTPNPTTPATAAPTNCA